MVNLKNKNSYNTSISIVFQVENTEQHVFFHQQNKQSTKTGRTSNQNTERMKPCCRDMYNNDKQERERERETLTTIRLTLLTKARVGSMEPVQRKSTELEERVSESTTPQRH